MNKGQKVVSLGLIISIFALFILEAWSLTNKHKQDTISEIVNALVEKWPIVGFLLGILMGHWIWPLRSRRK
jgi:hypothetical protein